MGSLLIISLEVDLLVILSAVNCEEKKSLEITWLSVKSGRNDVLPNTTFLDVWRSVLCGFDSDLTATDLLDIAVPVGGEDFVPVDFYWMQLF